MNQQPPLPPVGLPPAPSATQPPAEWQFFAELRRIMTYDPGGRGLDRVAGRSLVSLTAPDLEAACLSLARPRELQVVLVTGFYVARAECYETDGPLGTIFLAEVLHQLGARVTIVSEAGCQAVHEEALRLMGLEGQIRLFDLPAPGTLPAEDWLRAFWREHPHTTHLISIERAGPSHTLTSLLASYGQEPAPLLAFTTEVDAASWDKPHNMRGYDISPFTAPAHLLFESRPPGVVTIGIGDGGNEIGMGKLPWEVLRANIVLGGKIACRVPTQHLLVAGTSNWGAYALAAGLLQCRGRTELAHLFEAEREAQLWESVLRREPLVDGVTAASQLTVDGLAWPRFAEPLVAIGKLLRHGPEPVSPRRTQEPGNATS